MEHMEETPELYALINENVEYNSEKLDDSDSEELDNTD